MTGFFVFMGTFYQAPTANFVQKTLSGAISDSDTTITLSSTTNLQAPGVIVIDRVDTSGNLSSGNREVISYTGINSNQLTGCTRGFDNSTARAHADGAVIETTPFVGMWNNLTTIVASGFDNNGYLKAINSPASIAFAQLTQAAIPSIVSVGALFVSTRIDISSASITGLPSSGLFPVWRSAAAYSGPTIGIGGIVNMPKVDNLQWISVITPNVASGASIVFDILKNGTSIFAGVTKPTIVGGGTYVSTASINTKGFVKGDVYRFDYSAGGGVILGITAQGGTI